MAPIKNDDLIVMLKEKIKTIEGLQEDKRNDIKQLMSQIEDKESECTKMGNAIDIIYEAITFCQKYKVGELI